jgi:hypothetical protein
LVQTRQHVLARPAAVYVVAVLVAGAILTFFQYRFEQRLKPPSADVIAQRLVEQFIGADTVKSVTISGSKAEMTIAMDNVKALPADRGAWKQFFTDVTDVAAQRLFAPPPLPGLEALAELKGLKISFVQAGKEIARGEIQKGAAAPNVVVAVP